MLFGFVCFKKQALTALKNNWQTALFITFVVGLGTTARTVLRYLNILNDVPYITYFVELFVTPILMVSANYYFAQQLRGKELGMQAVTSRLNFAHKAVWLNLCIVVHVVV
ncbi:MAG: hypothetical protein GX096_07155 [Clostridiales bacterium]|nr:hypothetical protein [Clostridiales bacterium]